MMEGFYSDLPPIYWDYCGRLPVYVPLLRGSTGESAADILWGIILEQHLAVQMPGVCTPSVIFMSDLCSQFQAHYPHYIARND